MIDAGCDVDDSMDSAIEFSGSIQQRFVDEDSLKSGCTAARRGPDFEEWLQCRVKVEFCSETMTEALLATRDNGAGSGAFHPDHADALTKHHSSNKPG